MTVETSRDKELAELAEAESWIKQTIVEIEENFKSLVLPAIERKKFEKVIANFKQSLIIQMVGISYIKETKIAKN